MWRIPSLNSSLLSKCPPFFLSMKLVTFLSMEIGLSIQSRNYIFYCLWLLHTSNIESECGLLNCAIANDLGPPSRSFLAILSENKCMPTF